MVYVFRFIGLLLIAWGFNAVAAHASVSHGQASVVRQVEDQMGYALSVAPRVTYPPDEVNCWKSKDVSHWDYTCDASSTTASKMGTVYRDTYYRVSITRVLPLRIAYQRTLTSWEQRPWGTVAVN